MLLRIRNPFIQVRLVPFRGHGGPAVDPGLELRIVDPHVERVEPIDDLLHQLTHLGVVNVGDLGPRWRATITVAGQRQLG